MLSTDSSTYPSQIGSTDVLPANLKRLMIRAPALWTRLVLRLWVNMWGTLHRDGGPGGEVYRSQTSVTVSLTSTYYEALDFLTVNTSNVIGSMNPDTGTINHRSNKIALDFHPETC